MEKMWIKILRSFYWEKKPTKVGSIIQVPKIFARGFIANGQAEAAEDPTVKKPADDKDANSKEPATTAKKETEAKTTAGKENEAKKDPPGTGVGSLLGGKEKEGK